MIGWHILKKKKIPWSNKNCSTPPRHWVTVSRFFQLHQVLQRQRRLRRLPARQHRHRGRGGPGGEASLPLRRHESHRYVIRRRCYRRFSIVTVGFVEWFREKICVCASAETAESAVQQHIDPQWRSDLWEKTSILGPPTTAPRWCKKKLALAIDGI